MPSIKKRNIAICILLSVVTFGIYFIYWEYQHVKTTKMLKKNYSSCTGEMLCLIFVPFYPLYWWFTRGKFVKDEFTSRGYSAVGNETAYLILGIFGLKIISMAIMQNDFNSLALQSSSNLTKSKQRRTKQNFVEENYTEERLKPSKLTKNFFDIFEPIVFALIAVVFISIFVARLTIVDGASMESTLHNGEYIVVSDFMLSYKPKQGDIVVVQGDFEGEYYDKPIVKRVIATGGQAVKIEFRDNLPALVYVDGILYDTPSAIYDGDLMTYEYFYLGYDIDGTPRENANPNYNYETKVYEITVPEGKLFLMGDNRYHSADSRIKEIGCVPQKYIIGKAIFRLTPFSKMGGLYKD